MNSPKKNFQRKATRSVASTMTANGDFCMKGFKHLRTN